MLWVLACIDVPAPLLRDRSRRTQISWQLVYLCTGECDLFRMRHRKSIWTCRHTDCKDARVHWRLLRSFYKYKPFFHLLRLNFNRVPKFQFQHSKLNGKVKNYEDCVKAMDDVAVFFLSQLPSLNREEPAE